MAVKDTMQEADDINLGQQLVSVPSILADLLYSLSLCHLLPVAGKLVPSD